MNRTLSRGVAALFAWAALAVAPVAAQTATNLQETYTGLFPFEGKATIAILGDGFQADDQSDFNAYVDTVVMKALKDDAFGQDLGAFRIVRINADSADEGVTRVNAEGSVTTARNTAFDWRFSEDWNRCWMEPGPNTDARVSAALAAAGVTATYVVHVLNDAGFGGCRRGNSLAVTRGAGWEVSAHEFGHMVGGLCDEYWNGTGTYSGPEPGCVNLTINTARASIKWGEFVAGTTPLPTTIGGSIGANTIGAFEGGGYDPNGLWRPNDNSRMRGNTPVFNAPGYHHQMNVMRAWSRSDLSNAYTGDFDGDGRSDVLLHRRNSLLAFRTTGTNVAPIAGLTDRVKGPVTIPWFGRPITFTATLTRLGWFDRVLVADYTGDGRDDIVVFDPLNKKLGLIRSTGTNFEGGPSYSNNINDAAKPFGWGDRYFKLDFDGDNRDDLAVFNPSNFGQPVLVLYRSTGSGFTRTATYTGLLPGWQMRAGDTFYVADFTGDGKDDLIVHNRADWSIGYVGMLRSTGAGLAYSRRYDGSLPLWSDLRAHDKFYVGDWNGDGKDDLGVFNTGQDWCCRYLSLHLSDGAGLVAGHRYENNLPGWQMQRDDQFFVADINGDAKDDLYVYNATNWDKEYLGSMRSTTGGQLTGGWQKDWVGSWNLGPNDKFLVGDFGTPGRKDLFVRNNEWFGMLQSTGTSTSQVSIHHKYLKDYEYHRFGWW